MTELLVEYPQVAWSALLLWYRACPAKFPEQTQERLYLSWDLGLGNIWGCSSSLEELESVAKDTEIWVELFSQLSLQPQPGKVEGGG